MKNQQENSYQTAAEMLIPRLEKVRSRGPGSWMACCPAHDDKFPSLSIREAEDGKILLRCMAGCGLEEIVKAVGLEVSDLFPRRLDDDYGKRRNDRFPPFPWRDAIKILRHDLMLISMGAAKIAMEEELSEADLDAITASAIDIITLIEQVEGESLYREASHQVRPARSHHHD